MMKKLLMMMAVLIAAATNAQTAGDVLTWKKGAGLSDVKTYTTPVNSSLFSLNSSGNFALLAQSNFANASHTHPASAITDFNSVGDARWSLLAHTHTFASLTSKPTTVAGYGITDFNSLGDARWSLLAHTHVSADVTDASEGGNGPSDAGTLVKFGASGSISVKSDMDLTPYAIWGYSVNGDFDRAAILGQSIAGLGGRFETEASTSPALEAFNADPTRVGQLLHVHNVDLEGFEVNNDGGIVWTSATGAQTTATNLPAFGSATKGVVPASGGGTTNFLRADGTWAAAGGGSGTVTSVAALTLGTTGTDLSSTVANGTTTPVITLNVPTASASNRGALSAADWSAFNGKQAAGNYITALTGDGTASGPGSAAMTLATVNSNVGSFGSATQSVTFTTNAKGLTTAASAQTITPAIGSVTGLGTGIATALGTNTGAAGAPVLFNGALGTPTSGVATNLTGTASGLTAGNVTTNANLTGPITSVGNATTIADAELSAVASLTSAADKIPQFTGSGTATTQTLKIGTEVAYSGTDTYTAGGQPSGASNKRQFYTQIGNLVTWQVSITWANTSTTCTNVTLTFPTEFPTPVIPTGFTGASVKLYQCYPVRCITTPTGNVYNGGTNMIVRNAADTGFEIAGASFTSGSYRTFIFGGTYFTNP